MKNNSFNPWSSLPISNQEKGFSENVNKMWKFGIIKNDVPYLQFLVQKNCIPDELMSKNLVSFVVEKEADKVLSWLLHAPEFQNQVAQKETIRGIQKVMTKILDLQSQADVDVREKVLFKMMDSMIPYLMGQNLFKNNKGETFPLILLDFNPYIIGESSWKKWLLKPEVITSLLEPDKKGKTFFDKSKETSENLYRNSEMDMEYCLNCIQELEILARRKTLEKLPKSNKKTPSSRL